MIYKPKNFSKIGVRENTPISLHKHIQFSNICAIGLGGIAIAYAAMFAILNGGPLIPLSLFFACLFFLIPVANYFGWLYLSRVAIMVTINAAIYLFSTSLGRDAGIHFWYLATISAPFALFSLKEQATLIASAIFSLLLLIFLWLTKFQYSLFPLLHLNASSLRITSFFMITGSFVTNFFIVFFLYRYLENSLEEQKNITKLYETHVTALNASCIVAFTDTAGKITYVNDKFCEISGYTKDELLGKTHSIVNSGIHAKDFFKELWLTISSKKIWSGEICNKSKSGTFYWVQTNIVPMISTTGKIEKYISIRYDVTQLKLMEQSSIRSAKLASLGEMAGGIAHEINNPIGIIHGKASQLIKQVHKKSMTDAECVAELEKILLASSRISKIIRGLRAFSRNGDQDPFEPHSIKNILYDVLELCGERFKNHKIKINIQPFDDTFIECRPVQITQVITNLLNNAFDAIENLPEKWIRFSVKTENTSLKVSITDSGSGIPLNIADKLMQPFFTTKEVGKGTGLGLSISKGIIDEHKGKLWLDRESSNTCFIIELPKVHKPTTT